MTRPNCGNWQACRPHGAERILVYEHGHGWRLDCGHSVPEGCDPHTNGTRLVHCAECVRERSNGRVVQMRQATV
jgi:hypothetical protein